MRRDGEVSCLVGKLVDDARVKSRPDAKKAGSTGCSRAVPHLSTNPALSYLTSEFGWDPVHLT